MPTFNNCEFPGSVYFYFDLRFGSFLVCLTRLNTGKVDKFVCTHVELFCCFFLSFVRFYLVFCTFLGDTALCNGPNRPTKEFLQFEFNTGGQCDPVEQQHQTTDNWTTRLQLHGEVVTQLNSPHATLHYNRFSSATFNFFSFTLLRWLK